MAYKIFYIPEDAPRSSDDEPNAAAVDEAMNEGYSAAFTVHVYRGGIPYVMVFCHKREFHRDYIIGETGVVAGVLNDPESASIIRKALQKLTDEP